MTPGISILNSFSYRFISLRKERSPFNVALQRYLSMHSFHSVVEFIIFFRNDSFYFIISINLTHYINP